MGFSGCSGVRLGLYSVWALLGCYWVGLDSEGELLDGISPCCGVQGATCLGPLAWEPVAPGPGAGCCAVGAAGGPAGARSTCPGPGVHRGLSQDVGFYHTLSKAELQLPDLPPSGGSPCLHGSCAIPRVGRGSTGERVGAEGSSWSLGSSSSLQR